MPDNYTTPGVYVKEISTFPPSVVAVSTAVPAFIGYTEIGDSFKPVSIESLKDYEQTFGGPPNVIPSVTVTKDSTGLQITSIKPALIADIPVLYDSLRLYFDNGGGPCYVVSAGNYGDPGSPVTPTADNFKQALTALEKEDEPTLIVMPDATRLSDSDFTTTCGLALDHCGTMKNRFAILDVKSDLKAVDFRTGVSSNNLSYGAAYAPYLKTSLAYIYDETEVAVTIAGTSTTCTGTVGGLKVTYTGTAGATPKVSVPAIPTSPPTAIGFSIDTSTPNSPVLIIDLVSAPTPSTDIVKAWAAWKSTNSTGGFDLVDNNGAVSTTSSPTTLTTSANATNLASYKSTDTGVYNQVKALLNTLQATLPASGAVAGVYAQVDGNRGVWKAPANVALASVIGLTQAFTDAEQGKWNVDPVSGKSINLIRTFTGRGTLIWGARTLAGNDNEWRYVPVRRLFLMIESSSKDATAFAVFEPNTAETWLKVKAMIESFLYGLWEQGALAGSKPESAYFVNVGLGTTMTAQNILDGLMIVEIGVAAVRPAEFVILSFSHIMQQP